MSKDLITVAQAAKKYKGKKVSVQYLYQLLKEEKLIPVVIAGKRFIKKSDTI